MKFNNILVLSILMMCFTLSVGAQGLKRAGYDIETIKKEKAEFLKKELELTDAEAKAFIPLESEFMTKKFAVNRAARHETRALKEKANKTDADYQRITRLNLESDKREIEIQAEYYKKFSEVLPPQKIEKYRGVDLKFKEHMLKKLEERGVGNTSKNRRGQ